MESLAWEKLKETREENPSRPGTLSTPPGKNARSAPVNACANISTMSIPYYIMVQQEKVVKNQKENTTKKKEVDYSAVDR